jgi:hypothetical protein
MTRRATFYAVSEPVLRDISNLRLLASAGRLHPPLLLPLWDATTKPLANMKPISV